MKKRYNLPCNIAETLNIIGDRWTLLIIHELLIGHHTFSEIKKHLPGLSSKLLSERLKHLENAELLQVSLYSSHPPRYRYELTESGQSLESVFHALIIWGQRHLPKCYKKMIHRECGHEVRLVCYCDACQQVTSDTTIVEVESSESAGTRI